MNGTTRLTVSITPRAETTDVQIIGDWSPSIAPILGIPVVAGSAAAGIVVDGLQPGIPETLAILGTGATAGLGVGRAIWSGVARPSQRKLWGLQGEVRRFPERKRDPRSGGEPPGSSHTSG